MQEHHEYNSGQKGAGSAAKKMIPTPLGQLNKGSKGSIGSNIHHHGGGSGASGLKLERIIGSTVYNQHSFQLHPSAIPMSGALPLMIGGHSMNSEIVAYLAGTFVVLSVVLHSPRMVNI